MSFPKLSLIYTFPVNAEVSLLIKPGACCIFDCNLALSSTASSN